MVDVEDGDEVRLWHGPAWHGSSQARSGFHALSPWILSVNLNVSHTIYILTTQGLTVSRELPCPFAGLQQRGVIECRRGG